LLVRGYVAAKSQIAHADFEMADSGVGMSGPAQGLEGARTLAVRLTIDFGPVIGLKTSPPRRALHTRVTGRPAGCSGREFSPTSERTRGVADDGGSAVRLVSDTAVSDGGTQF
jgi:hypothetical protein